MTEGKIAATPPAGPVQQRAKSAVELGIEQQVVCPHCWELSPPQSLLWISEHQELLGDSVLGSEVQMRFKPTRFTVDCKAIDARGMACTRLACPRCHLQLPRQLVDCPPFFISIIGVPSSGKSYFLTSLTWQLRRQLPSQFATSFADADPAGNQSLIDYEQTLFAPDDPQKIVALRKTELQGELYVSLKLGEHVMILPKPFTFFIKPTEAHPNAKAAAASKQLHKVVCLYDNAGEHFQPGMETSGSPVTQHLGKARLLLFLFDPTQDAQFRAKLGQLRADSARPGRVQRQETVLHEAAARVRRQTGLIDGSRHKRPLIVVLPKSDVWEHLLPEPIGEEPVLANAAAPNIDAVDHGRVERVSAMVRTLLSQLCPELIAAAESFCEHVVYVPVSSVGIGPTKLEAGEGYGFRPADIKPRWVTVPILYGMSKFTKGLIAGTKRDAAMGSSRKPPASKPSTPSTNA